MTINDPPSPARFALAAGGAAAAQGAVAVLQAVTQSTAWLRPLGLPWPGDLGPGLSGASVVQSAAGQRWLRAYGTLPHPNLLAGWLLPGLGATAERLAATGRRRWLLAAGLAAGGLALTFSRAGWLGALGLAAVVGWRAWRGRLPRIAPWAATAAAAAALAWLPLLPYAAARLPAANGSARLEQRSVDQRLGLARASLEMARARPWLGVGPGHFVVTLAAQRQDVLPLEPVHGVPLLALSETGLVGAAALGLLSAGVIWRAWRRRGRAALAEWVLLAVAVGLALTGLLDHYWWTLAPARLVWVTVLGTWVGWGLNRPGAPPRPDSARHAR
jgi:putative inorganic carbon (HCO3(-)) transporter